jgi:hypothetical protein
MRSLYCSFRHGHCDCFYVKGAQYCILFRAAADGAPLAILSHATKALQTAFDKESIRYATLLAPLTAERKGDSGSVMDDVQLLEEIQALKHVGGFEHVSAFRSSSGGNIGGSSSR